MGNDGIEVPLLLAIKLVENDTMINTAQVMIDPTRERAPNTAEYPAIVTNQNPRIAQVIR